MENHTRMVANVQFNCFFCSLISVLFTNKTENLKSNQSTKTLTSESHATKQTLYLRKETIEPHKNI